MNPTPTPSIERLKPCPCCGVDCAMMTFTGPHIEGKAEVWMCANSERLGGSCSDTNAYLSPEAWNTRNNIDTLTPSAGEGVERIEAAFKEAYELGFLEGYEIKPLFVSLSKEEDREFALSRMDGLPEAWSDYRANLTPSPPLEQPDLEGLSTHAQKGDCS